MVLPVFGDLAIYPNPWNGQDPPRVLLRLEEAVSRVDFAVFTTAYRRVAGKSLRDVPAGVIHEALPTTDPQGRSLANGVYHVIVRADGKTLAGKWMVLR